MKEFIICAAIRHDNTGKIYYGHRHSHCIEASNGALSWTMNREEISNFPRTQRFVTSQNCFVDRKEALKISLENNQVLDKTAVRGKAVI